MFRTGSYFSSNGLCKAPDVAVVIIAAAEEGGGGAARRIDRRVQVAGGGGVVCGVFVAFPAWNSVRLVRRPRVYIDVPSIGKPRPSRRVGHERIRRLFGLI
jgi:hypothetical protein